LERVIGEIKADWRLLPRDGKAVRGHVEETARTGLEEQHRPAGRRPPTLHVERFVILLCARSRKMRRERWTGICELVRPPGALFANFYGQPRELAKEIERLSRVEVKRTISVSQKAESHLQPGHAAIGKNAAKRADRRELTG
jgi:hypothetical protein